MILWKGKNRNMNTCLQLLILRFRDIGWKAIVFPSQETPYGIYPGCEKRGESKNGKYSPERKISMLSMLSDFVHLRVTWKYWNLNSENKQIIALKKITADIRSYSTFPASPASYKRGYFPSKRKNSNVYNRSNARYIFEHIQIQSFCQGN